MSTGCCAAVFGWKNCFVQTRLLHICCDKQHTNDKQSMSLSFTTIFVSLVSLVFAVHSDRLRLLFLLLFVVSAGSFAVSFRLCFRTPRQRLLCSTLPPRPTPCQTTRLSTLRTLAFAFFVDSLFDVLLLSKQSAALVVVPNSTSPSTGPTSLAAR